MLTTMRTPESTPRTPVFIYAILVFIMSVLAAFTASAETPEDVVIKGWLHAGENDLSDALIVVELNGESCVRSIMLRNGRFEFSLPVGASARLLFEKPGYLTKEVAVDTRNALNSAKARKINKTVKFDVVLEEERKHLTQRYSGPVGSINFVKGTGTMMVRHDKHLVNAGNEE